MLLSCDPMATGSIVRRPAIHRWMPRIVCVLIAVASLGAGPSDTLKEYNRAYGLVGQGKAEEAISVLADILTKDPSYHRAQELAISAFALRNDLAGARRFVEELGSGARAGAPYRLFGRGRLQVRRFQFRQALATSLQCIRALPAWPGCYLLAAGAASPLNQPIPRDVARFRERALRNPNVSPELELTLRAEWPDPAAELSANTASTQRVLELAKRIGDDEREARALLSMMSLAHLQDDAESVRRIFDRLTAWAGERGNIDILAGAYEQTATFQREQGDAAAAIDLYRHALDLRKRLSDECGVANDLRQLASAEERAGDPRSALAHLERAAEIAHRIDAPTIEAFAWTSMAHIAASQGDYDRAIDRAAHARSIFGSLNLRQNVGALEGDLGTYFAELGDYGTAERYYLTSLRSAAVFRDTGERERILPRLAGVALHRGNFARAATLLRESIASSTRAGNRRFATKARIMLGAVLCREGKNRLAAIELKRALEASRALKDAGLESSAVNTLGQVRLRGGLLSEAAAAFQQAADLGERSEIVDVVRVARTGLGDVARQQGRLDAAAQEYAAAIAGIESVRGKLGTAEFRTTFLGNVFDVYGKMVDLLAVQGQAGEAFFYAEKALARSLLDRVGGQTGAGTDTLTASAIQRMAARHHAVLVEYFIGDSRSWVWAIDAKRVAMASLPGRPAIEGLVRRYRELTATRSPDAREAAEALRRTLLGPVAAQLGRGGTLIVVPDGVLHYLPFETLPAPPAHFLAESFTVSYAPSASVLDDLDTRPPPASGKELLAFGDPDFGPVRSPAGAALVRAMDQRRALRLNPLPSSRQEVRSIAALFNPSSVTTYLGAAATKSSLEKEHLPDYRRIHFATHAFVDEVRPERSGIALAAAAGKDGMLRSPEIARLKLNADLVVLSACETALGPVIRGEGVVGLKQAFLYAGASRVVASLWEVNDIVTAEFMRLFYTRMNAGESPATALRSAKIAMMNSGVPAYRDPKFWAPFVLIGKP
jgi:CHAT domain-containing protein/tetratricopeptide (TPR) repeat protein